MALLCDPVFSCSVCLFLFASPSLSLCGALLPPCGCVALCCDFGPHPRFYDPVFLDLSPALASPAMLCFLVLPLSVSFSRLVVVWRSAVALALSPLLRSCLFCILLPCLAFICMVGSWDVLVGHSSLPLWTPCCSTLSLVGVLRSLCSRRPLFFAHAFGAPASHLRWGAPPNMAWARHPAAFAGARPPAWRSIGILRGFCRGSVGSPCGIL